jgi:hypothetical protein
VSFLRHGEPDQPQPSRRPTETRVNTVKVTCQRTGPEAVIEEHNTIRQYTLADVEAWCLELRSLGAGGDLVLPETDGLVVTLNVK